MVNLIWTVLATGQVTLSKNSTILVLAWDVLTLVWVSGQVFISIPGFYTVKDTKVLGHISSPVSVRSSVYAYFSCMPI